MLVLGIILIALAALSVIGVLFTIEGENIEYFGIDMPAVSLFVIGALAVVFVAVGLWLIRSGTKRSLQARKEHRELRKLNEKLDAVDRDGEAEKG